MISNINVGIMSDMDIETQGQHHPIYTIYYLHTNMHHQRHNIILDETMSHSISCISQLRKGNLYIKLNEHDNNQIDFPHILPPFEGVDMWKQDISNKVTYIALCDILVYIVG